jgi:hypothetical protein
LFGGPVFAISDGFEKLRRGKSTFEILEKTLECPDARTRFLFTHGELDVHVNPEDTKDTVGIMEGKWGNITVFELQEGKSHAWYCNEYLDEGFRAFLHGSCVLCMVQ